MSAPRALERALQVVPHHDRTEQGAVAILERLLMLLNGTAGPTSSSTTSTASAGAPPTRGPASYVPGT